MGNVAKQEEEPANRGKSEPLQKCKQTQIVIYLQATTYQITQSPILHSTMWCWERYSKSVHIIF